MALEILSETVTFDRNGVRLVGDRWTRGGGLAAGGRGTVLLLHGGGQRRHSWRHTGERLAGQGWTAFAFDARGHGDSDWAPDGDYSLDALVNDLASVIASIGEPCVLVGASMGGLTALIGEGERGDLARALVLVDVAPRLEPAGVKRITQFMLGRPEGFASLDEAADVVSAYNPHRRRPRDPSGLRKNLRQGQDGRWYWHWDPAMLGNANRATRIETHQRSVVAAARIGVPTLLVRGAESDMVSDDSVAELMGLIPGARHVDVPATGHMVAGDDNDVFTTHLDDFLDGVIPAV